MSRIAVDSGGSRPDLPAFQEGQVSTTAVLSPSPPTSEPWVSPAGPGHGGDRLQSGGGPGGGTGSGRLRATGPADPGRELLRMPWTRPARAARGSCGSTPERTCSPTAAAIASSSPGSPEESELIARITSDDPDEVMPPPESRRQPDEGAGRAAEAMGGRGGRLERALVVHPAPAPGDPRGDGRRVVPQSRSIASSWRGSIGPA